MSAGIRIPERIPQGVAVAVERLRVRRIRNDLVCLQEPPQRAIVVARIIEVQAKVCVVILTCELVSRRRFPVGVARVAPGIIPLLGIFGAAARLCSRPRRRSGRSPALPYPPRRPA